VRVVKLDALLDLRLQGICECSQPEDDQEIIAVSLQQSRRYAHPRQFWGPMIEGILATHEIVRAC
jgi:hypothetical protein